MSRNRWPFSRSQSNYGQHYNYSVFLQHFLTISRSAKWRNPFEIHFSTYFIYKRPRRNFTGPFEKMVFQRIEKASEKNRTNLWNYRLKGPIFNEFIL